MQLRKYLLIVVLVELFLGGGGRLIDIGPLSIRMYLFFVMLVFSFFAYGKKGTINRDVVLLLTLAFSSLLLSAIIGFANGGSLSLILNDIKPLLFFASALFFFAVVKNTNDVELIVKLLKWCSVILAGLYLILFCLINLKLISFGWFYNMVSPTEEFFFRGNFAFFYKGFLYLCIGAIFYFWEYPRTNKIILIVLSAAIILTFTRGFILSIVGVVFIYLFFIKTNVFRLIVAIFLIVTVTVFGWTYLDNVNNEKKLNRDKSNSDRITQIIEVGQYVSPMTLFFGHGLGIGVPSRPEHMEISYLEIFHKQGLIGLSVWAIIFIYGTILYRKAKHLNNWVIPFYLSFIFVYVQSLTNPFMNNPIGLTMIIISLSSLRVLSRKEIPTDTLAKK